MWGENPVLHVLRLGTNRGEEEGNFVYVMFRGQTGKIRATPPSIDLWTIGDDIAHG